MNKVKHMFSFFKKQKTKTKVNSFASKKKKKRDLVKQTYKVNGEKGETNV